MLHFAWHCSQEWHVTLHLTSSQKHEGMNRNKNDNPLLSASITERALEYMPCYVSGGGISLFLIAKYAEPMYSCA